MDGKMIARVAAVVFVAVAITAAAIEMNRTDEPAESWGGSRPSTAQVDPLRAELLRCQTLGEAGPKDPSCLRIWAENRKRFLAPGARPAEELPQSPTPPRSTTDLGISPQPAPASPAPDGQ